MPATEVLMLVLGLFICDGTPRTLALNNVPRSDLPKAVELLKAPLDGSLKVCKYKTHRVFFMSDLGDSK